MQSAHTLSVQHNFGWVWLRYAITKDKVISTTSDERTSRPKQYLLNKMQYLKFCYNHVTYKTQMTSNLQIINGCIFMFYTCLFYLGKFFATYCAQLQHLPQGHTISHFNTYGAVNKFKLDVSPHDHVIVTTSTTDQINTLNFQTEANTQNYFY
jgi:hypothetical protein